MTSPTTHYARCGELSIAWQAIGAGPIDLLVIPGLISHVEAFHELPGYTRLLERLGAFARVITFDKRGNGLSDRVAEAPSLPERIDDIEAVLAAAGSRRTALLGISEGSALAIRFAATARDRVTALALFGAFPRMLAAPGYEVGFPPEAYELFTAQMVAAWGTGSVLLTMFGPSLGEGDRPAAARCERLSATPTTLRALWRMNASIDVRDSLPAIAAPTLVMHRAGDRVVPVATAHWLAARLPHARYLELPGEDHFPFAGEIDPIVDAIATLAAPESLVGTATPPAGTAVDAVAARDPIAGTAQTVAGNAMQPIGGPARSGDEAAYAAPADASAGSAQTIAVLGVIAGTAQTVEAVAARGSAAATKTVAGGAARPDTIASLEPGAFDRLLAGALADAPSSAPLEIGRFRITRSLGTGGMGQVYLAEDRDLERPVALKVLHRPDADGYRRFRREAIAVAALSHPAVVAVYELGLDASVPYLVMEYVPGGTAGELGTEPLPWRRAARLVACAARGLGAAHAVGIVHRDVKPANLLLPDPAGDVVKVADFGVAKLVHAAPLTQEGALVGTLGFLSPEQARGEAVDARADVWALGATLYRLLAGRGHVTGTAAEILARTMRSSIPEPRLAGVPDALGALVGRMGALDPAHRPADGNAVASALDEILG